MQAMDIQAEDAAVNDVEELPPPRTVGVSLARFAGFDAGGRFQVELNGTHEPVTALSTIALTAADAGGPVVIAYENGDARRPIIVGRAFERVAPPSAPAIKADGERLVISAEREIELRCGDASIVLTRAGKVLIRGNYVLTRSRGVNKIKGAYVDIN